MTVCRIIYPDDCICKCLLRGNELFIIRFSLLYFTNNSFTGVTAFFNITADLPVVLYLRGRIDKKREVEVVTEGRGEQGVETFKNEDLTGTENDGGIKYTGRMIIDGFFNRIPAFQE